MSAREQQDKQISLTDLTASELRVIKTLVLDRLNSKKIETPLRMLVVLKGLKDKIG